VTFADYLHRVLIAFMKSCPENLVTGDDGVESFVQRIGIESAFQTDQPGLIIGSALGLELIQKPQPFLGERKRSWRGGRSSRNGLSNASNRVHLLELHLEKRPFYG
jgi:hypothetical protein